MNMKSFLLGVVVGAVLTFAGLFVISYVSNKSDSSSERKNIKYLETPVSYENKKITSFKVFQVLVDVALANEVSDMRYEFYHGNTVMILGDNLYSDQVVTIKNPKRVGTYSYTSRNDMPMTVPVIDGDISY